MPDSDPDITRLADALRPALLRVSRRLRQEANRVGLSAQDALLLGAILKRPGIGVSELADLEQTSKPTMSAHVKRLEAAGWVERRGDAQDARRAGLVVTPAGAKQIEAIRRLRNDWLAARLTRLGPAERERLAAAAEPLLQLVSLEP
ncbi:MarR family winged helix-turn-helix transcriptional regulator [Phenylobacterium soli]|uniref:MarR family transcriptional regulator n=1 Tax=Phenylobacterium soli TaxID=2170551 RepID=A0A328AND1_9CAUL|nr:MarR family winged helix-turn-helix transcriptional regulator [Phenylobacterium soli]RAK55881.1 MarR family transcriptional regulator [Phenylobacterium soli]